MVDRYHTDTFSSIRGAAANRLPMEIANATVEAAPAHSIHDARHGSTANENQFAAGRCIEAAGREPQLSFPRFRTGDG